jgi:protein TonB
MNAFKSAPVLSHSSGAASAPAPAREVPVPPVAATPVAVAAPASAPAAAAVVDHPAEAAEAAPVASTSETTSESPSFVGAEPTFTFGGANVPEKSGPSKKTFLSIAAVVLVGAAGYYGWTQYKATTNQPIVQAPARPPLVPFSPAAAPASAQPATSQPTTTTPGSAVTTPTSAAPSSNTSVPAPTSAAPASTSPSGSQSKAAPTVNSDEPDDSAPASAPTSTKPAAKTVASAKPASSTLVVKGGTTPTLHAAPAAADADAPSMNGIAAPGAGAPPPNLVSGASAAKPILQTLNISQGVSQGLIIKQVQPSYPQMALTMRIEGSVELLATISKTGDITTVKVLSGDPQFTSSAMDAVKRWKYRPYLLNGEPVEIQTQVTINFKLPH